ncbi:MAG TPA: hypothetical protein DEO60_10785 [Bacteroidales bacterium]|jgi:hypothetical protein|nr:hypothetical protein [Bacteroidales bacterium]HBZ21608.1 hypothetical protein [Bacteroidales bacterium]
MKKLFYAILSGLMVLIMPGCNKTNDSGNGRLVVKITDAPFPVDMVESAEVTITKIEIRKAGDGICDSIPFLVVWEGSETFNLLNLRNGVVEDLLDLEIPAGEYNLIRLYVDEAGLKVKDGDNFNLKIPGGRQTGIKIFIRPGLVVEGGLTSELLLDFDLSRSFVMRGNMSSPAGIKGFIFKPVIRAVNNSNAGRLEGKVTDKNSIKIKAASIIVKQDTVVASAIADTMGYYAIIGLPSGTYSVLAAKENFDTVKVDGVKIVQGNRTLLNFVLPNK